MAEIARTGSTRDTIAAIYAEGIRAIQRDEEPDFVDWPTVNSSLERRYTQSGVEYVKARGWKLWEQRRASGDAA